MFTVNTTNITSITDVTSYLSLTTFPRLILISFNILIICLGLVGNGVVLCAAILHNILQVTLLYHNFQFLKYSFRGGGV